MPTGFVSEAVTQVDAFVLFVDLFFIISGFIMCYVYKESVATLPQYTTFLRKRFARLIPLHYAVLLLYLSVLAIATVFQVKINHPEAFDLSCVPSHLFLTYAFNTCPKFAFNTPAWSISAEMGMYILFPLLIKASVRSRTIMFVGSLVVLSLATSHLNARPWYEWTFDWGVARAFPSFVFGTILFDQQVSVTKLPFSSLLFRLFVGGFILGAAFGMNEVPLVAMIYCIVLFGLAADLSKAQGSISPRLAPLGQLTYSIYMLHEPILLIMVDILAVKFLHIAGVALNWTLAGVMLLIVSISYASFTWYETPARQWIAGGRRTRAAISPASS